VEERITMVDFNNENTITTPAGDVVKILILQRRNDFIEALEAYRKQQNSGVSSDIYIVQARLYSFFLELSASLYRTMKPEDFEELKLLLESKIYEDLIRGFNIINMWLDEKKLIRLDTKNQYDRRRAEEENKAYKV